MSVRAVASGWVWRWVGALAVVILLFSFGSLSSSALADTVLLGTQVVPGDIVQIDLDTNTVTTIHSTPGHPDSLTQAPDGRICYTEPSVGGDVRCWDPGTGSDVALASRLWNPADLTLTPGGQSLLVSAGAAMEYDSNMVVYSINLTTGALSTLGTYGPGSHAGLAFVGSNDLFAINGPWVLDLDPTNGSIKHSIPVPSIDGVTLPLDGMTYDAMNGLLYASVEAPSFGNGFGPGTGDLKGGYVTIDPVTLTMSPVQHAGELNWPDGVLAGSDGRIYFAEGPMAPPEISCVGILDTQTDQITRGTYVPGLDEVAFPAPEPSSVILLGMAAVSVLVYLCRRQWA